MMFKEIFSEKNRTADDGTLGKILFSTSPTKHRDPPGWHRLTLKTAWTGLPTLWIATASRHLGSVVSPWARPCWPQSRR